MQATESHTLQDCACLQGWPLPSSSAVWVMPSTSGAAPMTSEARLGPWRELSQSLERIPWPRALICPVTLLDEHQLQVVLEQEDVTTHSDTNIQNAA